MSLSGKWDVRQSRKLRLGSGNTGSGTAFFTNAREQAGKLEPSTFRRFATLATLANLTLGT
jgi:hypothetical protein